MSTPKFKVFATQPIAQEAIDIFNRPENNVELIVNKKEVPISRELLKASIKGVDALFCTLGEKIDKELLDLNGGALKVVSTISVGYDHIDAAECRARGIKLGYTPGVLTDATADLTIGLLLSTSRRLNEACQLAKLGQWKGNDILWMRGKSLSGSTVGIFGCGRIGRAIAKRLAGFQTKSMLYCNRSQNAECDALGMKFVDIDTLLAESDFLISVCAATKDTIKLFNLEKFKKMKSDAIFVNVARGSVVEQEDLVHALKNNIIGAAGLDVCTPEPLPADHELFKLTNCVLTPHIGSAEVPTRALMCTMTADNIVNGLHKKDLVSEIL